MTDRRATQRSAGRASRYGDTAAIRRRLHRRLTSLPWLARATAVGLSVVSLGVVLLFGFAVASGGELALITRPLPMQLALVLSNAVGLLTLGTVIGTVLAWRNHYWSLAARIHQTILAVLGLGFSWQLAALGFLVL